MEYVYEKTPEVINNLSSNQLVIVGKVGGDGCGANNEFSNKETCEEKRDSSSLYSVGFTLLEIKTVNGEKVYECEKPNSPHNVRNLFLSYCSESRQIVTDTYNSLQEQFLNLLPIVIEVGQKNFQIHGFGHSQIFFCMIDGKASSFISQYIKGKTSNLSTMCCFLCGKSKVHFLRDLDGNQEIDQNLLDLGISPLHCELRCFEFLFNMGIRGQTSEKITLTSDTFKNLKSIAQEKFAQRLHIQVFKIRHGFGSTNTGRTAREFFQNAAISAEILQLPIEIIEGFRDLLSILKSNDCGEDRIHDFEEIRDTLFKKIQVHPSFVKYGLTPTVHRILEHGAQFLRHFPIGIGKLSESALESRHKYLKKYRRFNSFQGSLAKNLQDIFARSLFSSDPYYALGFE